MDFTQLLKDFSVPHSEKSEGWVSIQCPWCNDHGQHLNYSLHRNYMHCWRCGWHPIRETLAKILRFPESSIARIMGQYGGLEKRWTSEAKGLVRIGDRRPHQLPSGTGPIMRNHRFYLKDRGFDADKIVRDWHVLGTGPVSILDGISYKHRILIPIRWNDHNVSFQTRDITDKSSVRYLSCPPQRELVPYKHTLYGGTSLSAGVGICVEGITDVWRLGGDSAFATYGTRVTTEQFREMAHRFRRVLIVFDPEPVAQHLARKAAEELKFRKVEAVVVESPWGKDPGSLSEVEAQQFVREILGKH